MPEKPNGGAHLLPDYPLRQNGGEAPGWCKDSFDALPPQPPAAGFSSTAHGSNPIPGAMRSADYRRLAFGSGFAIVLG